MEKNNLCVCEYCLQCIESHEGKQFKTVVYADPDDEQASTCDWCGESGIDTLYIIGVDGVPLF